MKLSIIVAAAANGVIGRDNQLPWRLPADLRHFKQTTMGKPILMGRKTWESIGRPLPGRTNIVITRDSDYAAAGCVVVNSIDAALLAAGSQDEIMVIGGAELYRQVLPRTDTIYLTLFRRHYRLRTPLKFAAIQMVPQPLGNRSVRRIRRHWRY